MMERKSISYLYLLIFLFLLPHLMYAGTTGKLAGVVTDTESGEPLAGVNVFLEGTSLGAASDIDGSYFILNIPPGTYNLKASYVGYAELTLTDVRVQIDLTTRLDIEMRSEVLVSEAIVVVAEKPGWKLAPIYMALVCSGRYSPVNINPQPNLSGYATTEEAYGGSLTKRSIT